MERETTIKCGVSELHFDMHRHGPGSPWLVLSSRLWIYSLRKSDRRLEDSRRNLGGWTVPPRSNLELKRAFFLFSLCIATIKVKAHSPVDFRVNRQL